MVNYDMVSAIRSGCTLIAYDTVLSYLKEHIYCFLETSVFIIFSDTERLYTIATQTVCDEFGKTYTWDMKHQVMGRPELEAAKMVIGND